jgi:hypothetical protein
MKANAQAQAQSVSKVCLYFQQWVFLIFSQPPPSVTVKPETEGALPLQRPFLARVTPSTGARGRVGKDLRRPRLPPVSLISSKRIKKLPSTSVDLSIETLPGGVCSESGIDASSSGTDTDDREYTCPKFTIATEHSDGLPEKSNTISDFLQSSPDTFGGEFFSSPIETSTFPDLETSACGANLDMLMTVEEHRLLTQEERTELYNLIDNSMPQAYGIEASSGAYNFHMNSGFGEIRCLNHHMNLLLWTTLMFKNGCLKSLILPILALILTGVMLFGTSLMPASVSVTFYLVSMTLTVSMNLPHISIRVFKISILWRHRLISIQ